MMDKKKMQVISILKKGGVGVVPTDTIYGIIGRVFSQKAVERLYNVRKRATQKPFIILIASLEEIALFDITLSQQDKSVLRMIWKARSKRKTSIIISCPHKKWKYLHRGTDALAFRLVHTKFLVQVIHAVGPLVAPSANSQGKPPAQTIRDARAYFGDGVDFYVSARRRIDAPASRIIRFTDGVVQIVRK